MSDLSSRTEMIIGVEGVQKLQAARVLVVGLGGVGGYVVEALARADIGTIGVLDNDVLSESNLNRQILAVRETLGERKSTVAEARIKAINPLCKVIKYDLTYSQDTAEQVPLNDFDYVVDAIDTVSAKVALAVAVKNAGVQMIASMSTGNKMIADFKVDDIYKTNNCPLAKALRKAYRAQGIDALKVVYSPLGSEANAQTIGENGRHIPGSISYVPAMAGLTIAGEVIRDLLK